MIQKCKCMQIVVVKHALSFNQGIYKPAMMPSDIASPIGPSVRLNVKNMLQVFCVKLTVAVLYMPDELPPKRKLLLILSTAYCVASCS